MPLSAGTRLGPYEVVDTIGAGGMGEVYRARDTKLDRVVAIKVLPEVFAADLERLSRFEREAKTLASLNHPNIAQVYGVIETPAALVMELVEGEDLATRLTRGAVPLDEAIPIARQIADALEAAHEQGIVHRDLKPANIRVRPDGVVKVLDFGLAKSSVAATTSGSAHEANSPTFMSPAMTAAGIILGTAAYMSPEQARGKPIDRRADIWAFGCVLYEMLTGTRPYGGEDISLTLAAILKEHVDFSRLPATTPPSIRRLLRRCLEKDSGKRLSAIGDARLELNDGGSDEDAVLPASSRRPLVVYGFGALMLFALGATTMSLMSGRRPAGAAETPSEFSLKRLTDLPGAEIEPDISPDGKQVVFSSRATGRWAVYLLRIGGRAINLTADSQVDNVQPRFSPEGDRIAFRSERDGGGIFVMGATGESVRRVTTAGYNPAWSPDGKSIAYSTEGVVDAYSRNTKAELWVADVATGQSTRIFTGDAVQPDWSPDGRRIAFWANTSGQRDIWTIAAGGGTPVAVTRDLATDWSPDWAPDGRWLYFSSDRGGHMNLWRIAVTAEGTPTGDPQPVTRSMTGVAFARLAAGGARVSVVAYSRAAELSLGDFDTALGRLGAVTTVRSPSLGWCAPSPAADWLACTSRGAQEDIVLMRSDGSETIRLMDDAFKDRNPRWSGDGGRIAFMSTRSGQWEVWSVRRDGSDLRQMTNLQADVFEGIWSPDGKQVLTGSTTHPPFGTWLFSAEGIATPASARFFKHTDEPFEVEAWSPDGRLVAGSLLGPDGLARAPGVLDLATGVVKRFDVPLDGAKAYSIAGWFPDSRRFLLAGRGGLATVDSETGRRTNVESPAGAWRYLLSGNGRRLMIEREVPDADIWLLESKR